MPKGSKKSSKPKSATHLIRIQVNVTREQNAWLDDETKRSAASISEAARRCIHNEMWRQKDREARIQNVLNAERQDGRPQTVEADLKGDRE